MAQKMVDRSGGLLYVGSMEDAADYQYERDEILAQIAGYDPTYAIVHHASWADYEESGWMFILRRGTQLYLMQHNYSVMADDDTPEWDPHPISEREALEEMIEWEQHEHLPVP
jgi:hypothetical protein